MSPISPALGLSPTHLPILGRFPALPDYFIDGDLQRFYFDFNSDGSSSTASTIGIDPAADDFEIRISFRLDATPAGNIYLLVNSNNSLQIGVGLGGNIRIKVGGGTVTEFTTLVPTVGKPYMLTVNSSTTTRVTGTLTALDFSEATISEFNDVGGTSSTAASWWVGSLGGGTLFFWDGLIWDLEYDVALANQSKWAFDDVSNTISDTGDVGGNTITLTPATGSWDDKQLIGDGLAPETAWSTLEGLQDLYDADSTNLDDMTAGVKRGSAVNSVLTAHGTHNFTLRDYGSGDRPIIQRMQTILGSTFTDLGGNHYTVAAINGTNPMSLVIDGTWFAPQPTQAAAADLGNENNKLWSDGAGTIHVYSSTIDPTAAAVIETADISSDISTLTLGSPGGGAKYVEGLALWNLDVRHGKNTLLIDSGWSGVTLTNCSFKWSFSPTSSTAIGIWTQGTRFDSALSDGLTVTSCDILDTSTHSCAMKDMIGAVYTDCTFSRAGFHSFEVLGETENIVFNRCKMHNPGRSSSASIFRFKATVNNGPFTLINCELWGPYNDNQQTKNGGTSDGAQGAQSLYCEGSANKIAVKAVNCTFYGESNQICWDLKSAPLQNVDFRLINCLVLHEDRSTTDFTGGGGGMILTKNTDYYMESGDTGFNDWGADVITDNNIYYWYTSPGTREFNIDTVATTFANWKLNYSGTYSLDGNSAIASTDPVTERDRDKAGTLDLSLVAGSDAIGAGSYLDAAGVTDPDVPTVDINGNPRGATPDAGCYQYAA